MRRPILLFIWLLSALVLFLTRWRGLPLVLTIRPRWGHPLPEWLRFLAFRYLPWENSLWVALAGATVLTLLLAHPTLARLYRGVVTGLLAFLTFFSSWTMGFYYLARLLAEMSHRSATHPNWTVLIYTPLGLIGMLVWVLTFVLPTVPFGLAFALSRASWIWGTRLTQPGPARPTKEPAAPATATPRRPPSGLVQFCQAVHIDLSVALLNRFLGSPAATETKGTLMKREDPDKRYELLPPENTEIDHPLTTPRKAPGMIRSLLERTRANFVEQQRQLHYESLTETVEARTKLLDATHGMRTSEEKLATFDERAEIERTQRELELLKLTHQADLEHLKTAAEKEEYLTRIAEQQANRKILKRTVQEATSPSASAKSPPPPVEEDLSPEEIHRLALQGVVQRGRSERAWKDWQETMLRQYSTWTVQQILEKSELLHQEVNR